MKRRLAVIFLLQLIMAPTLLAPAAADASSASRVVVVLSPYLRWEDLDADTVPSLHALAEGAALGNMNVKSRAPGVPPVTFTSAALMLSAGSWAAEDSGAPGAYSLGEDYETGDVAEAYRRFMGIVPDEEAIAYLGFPRADRANQFDTLGTEIGTLGQSIADAGGLTAAVGNSDVGFATARVGRNRPAALVAMDQRGLVPLGDVSRNLLQPDENGPYGVSTDRERFATVYDDVLEALDAEEGPALIVLDPGDAHRALRFESLASPDVAEAHRLSALETLDVVIELVATTLPDDGVLMVVTPVASKEPGLPMPLTPVLVSGPGWEGYVTSDSTHRDGLVTELDVTATILDVLGIERPVQVLGSTMQQSGETGPLEERRAVLSSQKNVAVSIDDGKARVLNTFIAFTVLALVGGTLLLLRAEYPAWVATVLEWALLLVLSVPVSSYLMFLLDSTPNGAWQATGLLAATTLVVWGVALALRRARMPALPVVYLSLLTAGVLLVDSWLGAPLSFAGFFSYSPLLGARYYGMGNEASALLVGSVLVGYALALDDAGDAGWTAPARRWFFPVVALVVVLTAAMPTLGANVGVAAWGTVAFALAWAGMNGVKVSWKVLLGVLVGIALIVVVLSAVDLGGGDGQTHLGRALSSAEQGGLDELWRIVLRKAQTNVRVLTHTNWTYLIVAILGFFAYMRWKPRGDFMEALGRFPAFAQVMTATLLGGLAAYFTEDSGIVIPAIMLVYAGVGTVYLMLLRRGRWGTDRG